MTPNDILALPVAQLPHALYEAGLAPADAVLRTYPGCAWINVEPGSEHWEPQERWDHAAPLLERFAMGLAPDPDSPGEWRVWTNDAPAYPILHAPWAEVPVLVCRLALMAKESAHATT